MKLNSYFYNFVFSLFPRAIPAEKREVKFWNFDAGIEPRNTVYLFLHNYYFYNY